MSEHPLLEIRNVGKDFDGNVVLKDISFTLKEGEILGLCGENGAGKSTMMNILFGMDVIRETGGYTGEIFINGEKIHFQSPFDALKAGIGMVHQEFSLIPGFSVAENILLNREPLRENVISRIFTPRKGTLKTIDKGQTIQSSNESVDRMKVDLDVERLVADLPVGHKQFIEIAREISKENTKILILDEPTAVLTESEADILLDVMRNLAKLGIAIIFISHRLREIMDVCDKVLIMRDGVVVRESAASECDIWGIARDMVGRNVETMQAEDNESRVDMNAETLLKVSHLWVNMPGERVSDVSLEIKKGEIFGVAGLAGQGKLGINNGLMGIYPAGGTVEYKGEPLPLNNTREALKRGLAFVSEDRRGVGLLLDEPISWNIMFNAMQVKEKGIKKILGMKFRDEQAMAQTALEYIDQLEIKCTGPQQKVRNLSGGNQQKICLSKAFALEPDLLLVAEPTRGIDVGAKELVLEALRDYNREKGVTILIVSSELEELRSIADRIAVICEGKVAGILSPGEPVEKFAVLMSGEKIKEVG